jgi:hypothetical protein
MLTTFLSLAPRSLGLGAQDSTCTFAECNIGHRSTVETKQYVSPSEHGENIHHLEARAPGLPPTLPPRPTRPNPGIAHNAGPPKKQSRISAWRQRYRDYRMRKKQKTAPAKTQRLTGQAPASERPARGTRESSDPKIAEFDKAIADAKRKALETEKINLQQGMFNPRNFNKVRRLERDKLSYEVSLEKKSLKKEIDSIYANFDKNSLKNDEVYRAELRKVYDRDLRGSDPEARRKAEKSIDDAMSATAHAGVDGRMSYLEIARQNHHIGRFLDAKAAERKAAGN